ncbi:type II toxin-antitoxin system VapB family antitoxin [Acidisoma cellulosilytica]|uniref:Type II toxin-antitoxin system VapB family antitoxin n=1 Tax=Acidisoma cellulosilyticum TaxID=2802395 RepID=A0A963YYF2_9PROT|nr:type II toxin-antitoxin system VapB family antitoxin [Acidisoma cellulosilyticum]MCB8879099.1 type II toxin-antitoxin system VapB family antitoxin [Acidisoma cellulosilyticum]
MPLYIKDNETARLVAELAAERGITKQAAVRLAVKAELSRTAASLPLRQRMSVWRAQHPLPAATGDRADKAFFDSLDGEGE